jgi:hypothetical protein
VATFEAGALEVLAECGGGHVSVSQNKNYGARRGRYDDDDCE